MAPVERPLTIVTAQTIRSEGPKFVKTGDPLSECRDPDGLSAAVRISFGCNRFLFSEINGLHAKAAYLHCCLCVAKTARKLLKEMRRWPFGVAVVRPHGPLRMCGLRGTFLPRVGLSPARKILQTVALVRPQDDSRHDVPTTPTHA